MTVKEREHPLKGSTSIAYNSSLPFLIVAHIAHKDTGVGLIPAKPKLEVIHREHVERPEPLNCRDSIVKGPFSASGPIAGSRAATPDTLGNDATGLF